MTVQVPAAVIVVQVPAATAAKVPVAEVDFASMLDDSPAAPVETAPPVSKTPPEVASASSDPLASAAPAESAEPLDFDALLND